MHFFLFFLHIFFSVVAAKDLKIGSIIKLDNNIPSECGLSFETSEVL